MTLCAELQSAGARLPLPCDTDSPPQKVSKGALRKAELSVFYSAFTEGWCDFLNWKEKGK